MKELEAIAPQLALTVAALDGNPWVEVDAALQKVLRSILQVQGRDQRSL